MTTHGGTVALTNQRTSLTIVGRVLSDQIIGHNRVVVIDVSGPCTPNQDPILVTITDWTDAA